MGDESSASETREYYATLLRDALSAWAEAGHVSEAFAPTLQSARLEEPRFSRTRLLGGKLSNLQPLMEYIGVLEQGPLPPTSDEAPQTTLDRACGVVEVSRLDMFFARALAFASEASRNETNAIAISLYAQEILGLEFGKPISLKKQDTTDRNRERNYLRLNRALHRLMSKDAAIFITKLATVSLERIEYCCYSGIIRFDLFADCMEFWKGYDEWRRQYANKGFLEALWYRITI